MVSKEQALDLALDYLTDGLRTRLKVSEGWPREVKRTSARAVWRVYVPSEELRVGPARYVIIDRETGEILADREYGE